MPKRKFETEEAEIEIDGRPINSLKVTQLRKELGKCGLPSKGKKQELVEKLSLHRKKPDPFNSLPDELVLKVVKMAVAFSQKESSPPILKRGVYNHTYIIGAISRVSSRFKRIARDQSLWSEMVVLDSFDISYAFKLDWRQWQEIVNDAVEFFLGNRVSDLVIRHPYLITELSIRQIESIAANCPNLNSLAIYTANKSTMTRLRNKLGPLLVSRICGSWSCCWRKC